MADLEDHLRPMPPEQLEMVAGLLPRYRDAYVALLARQLALGRLARNPTAPADGKGRVPDFGGAEAGIESGIVGVVVSSTKQWSVRSCLVVQAKAWSSTAQVLVSISDDQARRLCPLAVTPDRMR